MANCSKQMMAMMQKVEVHQQQLIDVEKERNTLWALKKENKIQQMNPMSVDKSGYANLIQEQQRIWRIRAATKDGLDGSTCQFGQFFGGTSLFKFNLLEY